MNKFEKCFILSQNNLWYWSKNLLYCKMFNKLLHKSYNFVVKQKTLWQNYSFLMVNIFSYSMFWGHLAFFIILIINNRKLTGNLIPNTFNRNISSKPYVSIGATIFLKICPFASFDTSFFCKQSCFYVFK